MIFIFFKVILTCLVVMVVGVILDDRDCPSKTNNTIVGIALMVCILAVVGLI